MDNKKKYIVSLGGIIALCGFVIALIEYRYFDSSNAFGFYIFFIGWILVVIGIILDRIQGQSKNDR